MEEFFYKLVKPIYYILLLSHITILKISNRRIFSLLLILPLRVQEEMTYY